MDTVIVVLGLVAIAATIFGIMFKDKKTVMLFFSVYFVLMLLTYALKNEYASAGLVFVGLARTLTYYAFSKKKLKPNVFVVAFFEVLFIAVSIAMWSGWATMIVLINFMIVTYTAWQDNMTIFRVSCAIIAPFMIFYNAYIGATFFVASEVVYFAATLFSIYRHDILSRRTKQAIATNYALKR